MGIPDPQGGRRFTTPYLKVSSFCPFGTSRAPGRGPHLVYVTLYLVWLSPCEAATSFAEPRPPSGRALFQELRVIEYDSIIALCDEKEAAKRQPERRLSDVSDCVGVFLNIYKRDHTNE